MVTFRRPMLRPAIQGFERGEVAFQGLPSFELQARREKALSTVPALPGSQDYRGHGPRVPFPSAITRGLVLQPLGELDGGAWVCSLRCP